MKVMRIDYPTPLSQITDIFDDNIDVFIELEDGSNLTVVISTPKNLISYMEKEKVDYIPVSYPDIIVKSLTHEIIKQAIVNYAQGNAMWLKMPYVASVNKDFIDMERINLCLKEIKS